MIPPRGAWGPRAPGPSPARPLTVAEGGTPTGAVFRCTIEIPADGVAGEWAVDYVRVEDEVGNGIELRTQHLVDAGLDPCVTVTR